ncbi:MAG TPA: MBL fold metallo-hydrolase [Chitinispirillaceae bacterium]|nr:MBL fold metallo-hydrolase [Chitinispirillaceae bacterium]
MLFERIVSEGLSQYSYLVADSFKAVVIDPRTDIQIYLDLAQKNQLQIVTILETHRHEDFLCGSTSLAGAAGAEIWHADSQWDYNYGLPVSDKQSWNIGNLKLESILTPGHTSGMMSYLLYDEHGSPWCIFTGDALFSGEIGRVDLMGTERLEEMASQLYDSIFSKLLLLGDQIIVCPAHGAGSVCGQNISNRIWTTIGLERLHNPILQLNNKISFIKTVARNLERPPYFSKMETLNLSGQHPNHMYPIPFLSHEFNDISANSLILDTREISCFAASHIPNSISIWADGISSYAGWFLPYDIDLFLVSDLKKIQTTVTDLYRLGFSVSGYLCDEFIEWHKAGLPSNSVSTITAQDFKVIADSNKSVWILDVRNIQELTEQGRIPDANNIPLTELPSQIDSVPVDRIVYIFCGSGHRSMIAASLLLQQGPYKPMVILGGFTAWQALKYPIEH